MDGRFTEIALRFGLSTGDGNKDTKWVFAMRGNARSVRTSASPSISSSRKSSRASLKEDLDRVASRELGEFSFPLSLWVNAVYLAINAFSRSRDPEVIDALRVLWQGRFLSLVRETQEMNDDEAEQYIRGQLDAFQQQRSILSI